MEEGEDYTEECKQFIYFAFYSLEGLFITSQC